MSALQGVFGSRGGSLVEEPVRSCRSSRARPSFFPVLLAMVFINVPLFGQALGTASSIQGTVLDPSGAPILGAAVKLQNPASSFVRSTTTNGYGQFEFANVPLDPYQLTVTYKDFEPAVENVELRSGLPVQMKFNLKIAKAITTVTVTARGNNLVEKTPTAHTDVSQALIATLPIQSPSIGLSQVVTNATPGVVADANGFFHPLGEHSDTQLVVDGQPTTDQQAKIFANQLPMDAVQSMKVIDGTPPAEYGDMTSLIIDTSMKSGLGMKKPHGSLSSQYGSFGSWSEALTAGWGGNKWGNFLAVNGDGSSRYLDSPEFTAFHDKGNDESFFDRVDWQPNTKSTAHLDLQLGRSWFQIPNTYDQLAVGQDQRQQVKSIDISPEWTHLLSTYPPSTPDPDSRIPATRTTRTEPGPVTSRTRSSLTRGSPRSYTSPRASSSGWAKEPPAVLPKSRHGTSPPRHSGWSGSRDRSG